MRVMLGSQVLRRFVVVGGPEKVGCLGSGGGLSTGG